MWQVLVAAAVVVSTSLVAKHLLNTNKIDDRHNENKQNPLEDALKGSIGSGNESKRDSEDGIFRFSSPESVSKTGSHRSGAKNSNKKKKKKEGAVYVEDQNQKVEKKRFRVCLKKRKTVKSNVAAAKRGSGSSKGKSEISKLNTAVDETAKVVQELNTEIYKRKSSHVSSSAYEDAANSNKIISNHTEFGLGDSNNLKAFIRPVSEDWGCGSSTLTEEPAPEVVEMDRLEAELESELQKLPWCITECSFHDAN